MPELVRFDVPKLVKVILKTLVTNNYEVYIVGGAVRDLLLGTPTKDWDFTTNATPEQIQALFPDSFYDNTFGTVGVAAKHLQALANLTDNVVANPDEIFEITTYRSESAYSDSRRPDHVEWGKTIEEDLKRRDFTINAMALKPMQQPNQYALIDPYAGHQDLKKKIIRTVGNPKERFREDALRMLRAIRFGAQLGLTIEPKTLEVIQQNAVLITKISWERIRDEFLKLLVSNYPKEGIILLYNSGLLAYILPELIQTIGVKQSGHHIYDVWNHMLNAVQESPSKDPVVRLATLLHDIAKPTTARKTPKGSVTFYGHEVVGSRMAKEIAIRFRLPKKDVQRIFTLVRWHMFVYDRNVTDAYIRRFIRRVGHENIPDMMDLRVADRLGSGSKRTSWRLEEMKHRVQEQLRPPFSMHDMVIDGNDVMRELNLKPGPEVGNILKQLFEDVVERPEHNTRDYLLERLKQLKK